MAVVTPGNAMAVAGLLDSYASAQASKAAAIEQQTGLLLQARNAVALAEVNANYSEQYAMVQAGRKLKQAEMESLNYKVMGNTILKNMRSANATARARAAANGVALGAGGSIEAVQIENTRQAMFDVGVTDMNALAAQVFGFEDASAMMESTQIQNIMNQYAAAQNAGQYELAGSAAVRNAGLLSNAKLMEGALEFGKTFKVT